MVNYLRLHVLGDAVGLPGAVVFLAELSRAEDLQGRVSPDLEPAASVLAALSAVNLKRV